jgi:ATP-dependent DNA helicase RecG
MRRIAMCEQVGTGLRMMRETWRKLDHPAPIYKNDRASKAFELFIPELDKEVDMASDLVKTMFSAPHSAEAQVEMLAWQKSILTVCSQGEKTGKELLIVAGYRNRTGNFEKGLQYLVDERLLELTIPNKPNSWLQKYRLTAKGRRTLSYVLDSNPDSGV